MENQRLNHGNAKKISLLYLLIASGWILISDHLVNLATNNTAETTIQSYKGLFFVIFTSGLLYVLIFRHERKDYISNQKLINSEDRYRKFVDQLSDMVFRIDLAESIDMSLPVEKQVKIIWNSGYIADLNSAFTEQMLSDELSHEMNIPLHQVKHLIPDVILQRFITSGHKIIDQEHGIKVKDGSTKYLIFNLAGFSNQQSKLDCIWVTINDISKVKSTESRLELALKGGQLGIWDLYLPEIRVEYNEQMADMLGYTIEEIGSGLGFWEKMIHPEDISRLNKTMNRHLRGATSEYRAEFRIRCKNGQYKWVLGVGKVMERNDEGEPIRASGIHMDISERKNAEKKLQDNNYFIHSIISNLQEGLIVYDLNYHIILWNKKMEDITGYQLKKVLNKNPFPMFPHLKKEDYENFFSRAISGNICSSGDIYYKNEQGKAIWYNSIFSPYYSAEGEVVGIIEVLRDISERKKHESNLAHHNKELSKTNEELDNFVYRVSHDLRAPITSSLGLARLSKTENDRVILKQYAAMQEKSLVKLDKFIQDILDYSRNSRMEVQRVTIDFEQLIKEVLQNHSQHSDQKKVAVETRINQAVTFNCDELRLRIVLNNLISNALKFQNPYQEKPKIEIQVNTNNEGCKIIVADNGMGIAHQHLEKLFNMFYRATDKQPGSGIGLYIVKDCLKKLQGDIKVESELDKGTRFLVDLPL